MDIEKLQRDLKTSYNKDLNSLEDRVEDILNHISDEWSTNIDRLNMLEMKTISNTLLDMETTKLHDEIEILLAQKEKIERDLERKAQTLQETKYNIFNAIESHIPDENNEALLSLHQVKLQSIDLFDLLSEMVESALITALEKDEDGDIADTTEEIIKELTYEALKEGSLSTIRIRKILSTIVQSAIDISEASPTRADEILTATLKGMRSGLIRSISKFKKDLTYMPIEAKQLLIEDYDTIVEELAQTDTLFSQVINSKANESSSSIKKSLLTIEQGMKYDLEELVHISKETVDIIKDRFSSLTKNAVKSADNALNSQTAQEAKRMGKQAWGVARTALGTALKSAKDAIDTKEK